jgi:hypothetical protein
LSKIVYRIRNAADLLVVLEETILQYPVRLLGPGSVVKSIWNVTWLFAFTQDTLRAEFNDILGAHLIAEKETNINNNIPL